MQNQLSPVALAHTQEALYLVELNKELRVEISQLRTNYTTKERE